MFTYANMNLVYHRYSLDNFLDSSVRLGFQAIELWGGEPHLYVDEVSYHETKIILRAMKSRGLELICFTPEQCNYPINLSAKNNTSRKRSVEYFRKCIQISNSLECPMLLISAGYGLFDEPREEAWQRALESIREIAREAESAGVVLALEPFYYPYSNVLTNLETAKRMITEVNSNHLKAMLDTPCMVVAGDTIDDYAAAFGDDLVHIHFVDGNEQSTAHLVWGEGNYPLRSFKESLTKLKYEGYLTLELFGTNYNAEPEKAVQKSLEYLASVR